MIQQAAVSAIALIASMFIVSGANAVDAKNGMVAAEHELAAQAGLKVLKDGGNAIDAACAAALAVGVTNASSCGIGGGGFMLIYLARTGKVYALNYRERAPMAVRESMFIRDGKPDDELLRSGPLAAAVPGEVAGIAEALRRFGTLRFSAVAQPAIDLAQNGYVLQPGDMTVFGGDTGEGYTGAHSLFRQPNISTFFMPGGKLLQVGDRLRQPQLAATLRLIHHPRHGGGRRISGLLVAAPGVVQVLDVLGAGLIARGVDAGVVRVDEAGLLAHRSTLSIMQPGAA